MRPFATIAINAFMELVRQPVYLLLMTASSVFCVFLASIPYFGFGDDPKLVKDSALAVTFLAGLLGAVLCASSSLAREIRTGTALAVLSKPIGRAAFLLAKFAGLAAALTVLTLVNVVACLLASRMGYDAYGDTDWLALGVFSGAVVAAYALGAFSNFFLGRPFVSDAVLALVGLTLVAFVVINFFDPHGQVRAFGTGVDWRVGSAGVLLLFALWILAALALLCSTRLEMISTLVICSAFFLVGLMSDYLYHQLGGKPGGGPWYAEVLYAVLPNWQQFWMADALAAERSIPLRYVAPAFGYMLACVGAALSLALVLFEDRELS